MEVYTCTGFKGVWPTGTAAVVCAEDENQARALLNAALRKRGMAGLGEDDRMIHLAIDKGPIAVILADGDY